MEKDPRYSFSSGAGNANVAAAVPISRQSFISAGKRLNETENRLRNARERLVTITQSIRGPYPTSGQEAGGKLKDNSPPDIASHLHNVIDVYDEEIAYILDAVCALESSCA